MRGISFLIAGVVASSGAAAALASGCSTKTTGPGTPIALSPSIVVPEGLISQIASLTLSVYSTKTEAGLNLTCNPKTGQITGNTNDAAQPEPIAGGLRSEGAFSLMCDAGVSRCSDNISVPASGTPQIFFVAGVTNNVVVATGCATMTIDPLTDAAAATAVPITITLQPNIKLGKCGNGIVEVGETCDTSGQATDPECDASTCQTVEEVLSVGSASTNTNPSPAANTLKNPSFSWPAGATFVASFTDTQSVLGSNQVDLRIMGPTLAPTTGAGAADSDEFILPNASFPSQPAGNDQEEPQSVQLNGNLFTVFSDDFSNLPDPDIHLRETILSTLTNAETNPCGINGTNGSGETGNQSSPMLAASAGNIFIVWQEPSAAVAGRMYTPNASGTGACGTLGPQTTFGAGQNGSASVAAIASGWVVAWQSGTAVQMQLVNAAGGAIGGTSTTLVSTGTGSAGSPNVGSLPDGSGFAIAWADTTTGNILAQRYTVTVANGTPAATKIQGDQPESGTPIAVNNLVAPGTGDPESTPFVTGSTVDGGFYVVTWVDQQAVHARLLSGTAGTLQDPSGYLFNGVTGLADEFQVSTAASAGHVHTSPTAAVGGGQSGLPFIAFGWADTSSGGGIIARRFPIPSQTPWE
jgi:hypothetical protein